MSYGDELGLELKVTGADVYCRLAKQGRFVSSWAVAGYDEYLGEDHVRPHRRESPGGH